LDRITDFLAEDEVTDRVSSSIVSSQSSSEEDGFGIMNASFKWNEGDAVQNRDKNIVNPHPIVTPHAISSSDNETMESEPDIWLDSSLLAESTDNQFELKDISVIFPQNKLSVIIGPTASGKTAFLVRYFAFLCFSADGGE
jgi:hypothetical protein